MNQATANPASIQVNAGQTVRLGVLSDLHHVRGHALTGNILQLGIAALAEHPNDVAIVSVTSRGTMLTVSRQCHSLASDRGPAAVLDPARTSFSWRDRHWREEPSA